MRHAFLSFLLLLSHPSFAASVVKKRSSAPPQTPLTLAVSGPALGLGPALLPMLAAPQALAAAVPGLSARPAAPAAASLAALPSRPAPAAAVPAAVPAARAFGARPLTPGRLGALFDGRPEPGLDAEPRVVEHQPKGEILELHALARSWKTADQLARLDRSPRAPGETFEFTVLGDAEPGRFWFWRLLFNKRGMFPRILRRAAAEPGDFIFQLGDMVSEGNVKNYLKFFGHLLSGGLTRPYLTAIGNHDRYKPHGVTDSLLYRSLFGKTNYWFERGGVRFVVLDTSLHKVTPLQLKWLDRVLDTDKTKIVLTHMAPNTIGSWNDFGAFRRVAGFKDGAEAFTDIVSRRKVTRVYSGHVHGFGVREYKGVKYVLTGGGGSPLFPSGAPYKFYHYLTVRAGPEGITETVRKLDGTRFVVQ